MNKKHSTLLKVLLALFALNSISLYLYFSAGHHNNHQHLAQNHRDTTVESFPGIVPHRGPHLSKPWPIIPSYLPWSLTPNVDLKSCEAYFGNGFTRVADVLSAKAAVRSGSSWFRCHYSGTLRSSVCEGGKIRMDPEKIKMSRGGEKLEDVIGRNEEEELPEFQDGAFEVEGEGGARLKKTKLVGEEYLDEFLPVGDVLRHTMRELVRSIVVVGENDFTCQETQLEDTWKALFSSLRFAKNFSGPVCFRHAVLSPLGYETPLFKGLTEDINCHGASAQDLWQSPDDKKTARLSEFGEMIRIAFGFPVNRHHAEKAASGHNVLFVRREDYLAHPRHKGKVESRLSNEQEVFDSLQRWASNHLQCKVNLINGLFAHMTMKEQVQAIQDASVIIGAHGAGLTHIVSATPNTVILELISSFFRRPHFQLIAQWKGLQYHAINLDGSHAKPGVVIDKLNKIMRSLGC
ncbi:beta-(1,2)-xylosyltransferase-like isoform X3 [Durio zibethinus]|uniref:Beta-(1,2)-xylosyltransferase-like isoform X3 n=1 Tax=Durio zibethinus TaxID=66656 RepID=A0A6P5ZKX1_DURZI|nr:beta-(1,2)-xylosyltransferase-like isoform X3 [Durio zibethinus]